MKVGDPNQYTDLDMGPLIDANALKSVEEKVKKAIEQGARVADAVVIVSVTTKDISFEPTILRVQCTQRWILFRKKLLDRYFRLLSLQRWKTPLPGLMIVNMG
ncbi:MAG: aldehyde dehydrogenase family protein [Phocaeicola vulgatus]